MADLTNSTLANRYFLKRLAGEGGMAQVYQAWDQYRTTDMAIKVISDLRFFDSLLREAVALRDLAHPNIVRLYSVEKDDVRKIVFLVMDWVDGKDLKGILDLRKGPMGIGEVRQILDCIHKALHYAHKLGVCHCDLKPANILMKNSDGQAILSDFGLAQVAQARGSGGTLAFMAPELFQGASVSVASDIYSLGVTLYQLLSGRLPFAGNSPKELIQAHISSPPPHLTSLNPDLPDGVVQVIEKSLAKDPGCRPATVTDLWVEFSRHAQRTRRQGKAPTSILTGIKGSIAGKQVPIPVSGVSIGRGSRSQLRLQHPTVSRDHATITCQEGHFVIRDMGSTRGTFVNGTRLGSQEQRLRSGDRISIGASDVLEFRDG